MSHPKTPMACGSWPSPVSAEMVTAGSRDFSELQCYEGTLYWIEKRPQEAGRNCIVKLENGTAVDRLPPGFNARSRVHEFGGGVYRACAAGIFFCNDEDQQIYHLAGEHCRRLTNAPGSRFADLVYDAARERLICVREHHGDTAEPENTLVAIDIGDGAIHTLDRGHDFYASPRPSPDGSALCWICWDHPNMPWDGTRLMLAEITADGRLAVMRLIAGGPAVSVFQPAWSISGTLYYVSDESGWWNLYRHDSPPVAVTRQEEEFGLPQWVFAQSSYAVCAHEQLLCSHSHGSGRALSRIDAVTGHRTPISTPFSDFSYLCADGDDAYMVAGSTSGFPRIVRLRGRDGRIDGLVSMSTAALPEHALSTGMPVSYTSRHGDTVHANYYPPVNAACRPLDGELPPLVTISHGGPTGQSGNALDLRKQFWTSRGFALLDVNYSGSTGYGRAYRRRLDGLWGKRDVEDVCDGALHLAGLGLVDRNRLIIRGSSAGGLTVLAALAFEDVFMAGACYYGISELETLASDTHKFESHYMDRLVGPWPEAQDTYASRSPINHVGNLRSPVIFFQGLQDRVVPPSQSERMVKALEQKGIPVSYITFENEQHGFRSADTIRHCLRAELWFYSRVFGFEAAGEVERVPVMNLDSE